MTPFHIYLITRLDALHTSLVLFTGISLAAVMSFGVATGIKAAEMDWEDVNALRTFGTLKKALLASVVAWLALLSSLTLCPTTKEAALIYAVPAVVNNKNVQEIPENLIRLANEKLKQMVKELEEEDK